MAGLHVPTKAERVAKYHEKTVHVALEITGALGYEVHLTLQQVPCFFSLSLSLS